MQTRKGTRFEENGKKTDGEVINMREGFDSFISEDIPSKEYEMEEENLPIDQVHCGLGSCASDNLQQCASVGPFTANTSALFLVNIAFFTYYLGIIRTIEKRFDLSSTRSSFTISMMDIMFSLLSLFVGYAGRLTHKPRLMVICQGLTSIGIFILVLPFAIYGPKQVNNYMDPRWTSHKSLGLCDGRGNSLSSNCFSNDTSISNPSMETSGAYALLLSGSILIGFGGVAVSNLGIPYIDENAPSDRSAFYVGLATSTYSWAPIVGLLLAAMCTRIPEDLNGSGLEPSHPQWVGAWWLGMAILGLASLVIAFPMAFFPKHLYFYYRNKQMKSHEPLQDGALETRKSHLRQNGTTPGDQFRTDTPIHATQSPAKENKRSHSVRDRNNFKSAMKDIPRLMVRFFTNTAYVTLLISKILSLYGVTGVILQLPRYMEIHYRQPAYIASIIAALSGGIVGAVGTVLGGYVIRRMKLSTFGIAKIFVMATVFGTLGTAVCMAYGCPQLNMAGHYMQSENRINVENSCTSECDCNLEVFQPVCADNFKTFFSPCHAGCSEASPLNKTFYNCKCAEAGLILTEGYCPQDRCNTLVPYIITFLVVSFLVSFGRVPATILMFRLVGDRDKAPAMGLTSFFTNVLCFVPAPILFGYLFDSACLIWKTSCNKTGACLVYDTAKFRLLMHGVTLAFQIPACIFAFITLYIVSRNLRGKNRTPHIQGGHPKSNGTDFQQNGAEEDVAVSSIII